jgi:hypothetical protein
VTGELPLGYDEYITREPPAAPDRDWRDALYEARKALEKAELQDGDFDVCVRVAREFIEEAEERKNGVN